MRKSRASTWLLCILVYWSLQIRGFGRGRLNELRRNALHMAVTTWHEARQIFDLICSSPHLLKAKNANIGLSSVTLSSCEGL